MAQPVTPSAPPSTPSSAPFAGRRFVVKEKRLTFGRQYRVFNEQGALAAYCKQKMFKLREDIRFYADEAQQRLLFRLAARKVLDFNANLDVLDADGRRVGSVRRKGWRSILRDQWEVCDPQDRHVATMSEDSWLMALLRRFLARFIPYSYHIVGVDGRPQARIKERFQLFGDTYDLVLEPDARVDPRTIIALAVCIDALETE